MNLAPIQDCVNDLQVQHRELHDQVVEQNISIQKVEDQLQMVREATDRNTLEQQELMEDLKAVGNKVNVIALIALGCWPFPSCLTSFFTSTSSGFCPS